MTAAHQRAYGVGLKVVAVERPRHRRPAFALVAAMNFAGVIAGLVDDPLEARVAALAAFCLTLWLTEATAPFVPTLLLVVGAPLLIGPLDARVDLARVVGWGADPILALFFGGFALAAAAQARGWTSLPPASLSARPAVTVESSWCSSSSSRRFCRCGSRTSLPLR